MNTYEPDEVNFGNIHVILKCILLFLSGLEEGKSDNDNNFKISCATYCNRTILDSAKQTK